MHAIRFIVGLHYTENSIQLLNMNTTKFQVEREPVYAVTNIFDNVWQHLFEVWVPFER